MFVCFALRRFKAVVSITTVWKRKWKEGGIGILFVQVNDRCDKADHLRRIWRIIAEITHVISVTLIQNSTTLYWWWIRSEITNLSTLIIVIRWCVSAQWLPVPDAQNFKGDFPRLIIAVGLFLASPVLLKLAVCYQFPRAHYIFQFVSYRIVRMYCGSGM